MYVLILYKQVLRNVKFFKNLDPNLFKKIRSIANERIYSRGSLLIEQGEMAEGLIIITHGKVSDLENNYNHSILQFF